VGNGTLCTNTRQLILASRRDFRFITQKHRIQVSNLIFVKPLFKKYKKIVSIIFSIPALGSLAWFGFLHDIFQPSSEKTEFFSDDYEETSIINSSSSIIAEDSSITQNNFYSDGDSAVKGTETDNEEPIFISDFQDNKWTPEKNIRVDGQEISLYWAVKNGYLLTKDKFSEHFTVSINFIPLSESINFSFILEDAFKLVFGDGDNQEIILKKFDINDPNWVLVKPNNETSEDRPYRIRLKEPILINKEINLRLSINAKTDDDNRLTVQVSAKFFGADGNVIQLDEPFVWGFSIDGRLNRERRLGVGLVDEWPWTKPKTRLIDFKVNSY